MFDPAVLASIFHIFNDLAYHRILAAQCLKTLGPLYTYTESDNVNYLSTYSMCKKLTDSPTELGAKEM